MGRIIYKLFKSSGPAERQGQTVQVIQEFLCVLSIFITLYGSLWIGCLFDDACFAANFGGL